ncbi:MAG: RNA polymerase sigma factor [Desulfobacterales bacterium]|nr:RNA polymerase sigma factor [Desulfobacterales bacterium]
MESILKPSFNIDESDESIIHQVINGDINVFENLLLKYKSHVFKVVYKRVPKNEVEEIAHEVFIKAYLALPNFKFKSSFKSWLSGIAIRTSYDFWRNHYKSKEFSMSSLSEKHQTWLENVITDQSMQLYNDQSTEDEAREVLNWALNKLKPEERMMLDLVYFEGLSGKEIAGMLDCSLANIKIKLFRTRNKLRRIIEKQLKREA